MPQRIPDQITQPETNNPDVERLIQQRVGAVTADSARTIHAMKFMSDLPPTYRELLPKTADQDKLGEAEQAIRSQYRDEMREHAPLHARAMGWTPPNGSQDDPHSTLPRHIDMSKMSGTELIRAGLALSKPQRARE